VAKSGERRMLFDIRGRRKRVIQVAYAVLALLMALSLFTVVGPVNLGDVVGTGGSGSSGSDVFVEQAERIDRKLAKDPKDEDLHLRAVRAWSTAGQTELQPDATGRPTGDVEASLQYFRNAGDAWLRYAELDPGKPNPTIAQIGARALYDSAYISELDTRVKEAAEAQAIAAAARPSVNAYVTLAQYRLLAGDEKGAEQAARKARQQAPPEQRELITQSVDTFQKQTQEIRKQAARAEKAQAGAGQQALQNPLGGLSGGSGTGTASP
jgi:hypothetical protein